MNDDDDWRGALLAEFTEPGALVEALRRARDAGYRRVDAFTPFPVMGVPEALGLREGWLAWVAAIGFLVGGALGYLLQCERWKMGKTNAYFR